MRIFIVGCAKTGTWLLTRLFYAFEDFALVDSVQERPLGQIIDYQPPRGKHAVMKRTWAEVFSCYDAYGKHGAQREAVREHGIKLVYTYRNKDDVMASMLKAIVPQGATPQERALIEEALSARYDACGVQAAEHADLLAVQVDFARLLSEPDVVQKEVAEALGLQSKHKWSDYPDFVPSDGHEKALGANYSLRRLGASY